MSINEKKSVCGSSGLVSEGKPGIGLKGNLGL